MLATANRELTDRIEETLLVEAVKTEMISAQVRTIGLGLTTIIDIYMHFRPMQTLQIDEFSLLNASTKGFWFLISLMQVLALRRGYYRHAMRVVVPLVEGLMAITLAGSIWWTCSQFPEIKPRLQVNMAAVCTLFAVTGALRFYTLSAILTTVQALVVFAIVGWWTSYGVARTVFAMCIILSAGLTALWLTFIVRRAMESEVGRSMLECFLPRQVVQDAHRNPLSLLTSPRSSNATIVVTDIRGFTAMSETMEPAEVLAFLSELQGSLARVVHEFGGTVDKFMGDGMLAVFGAPEPLPDHADRALHAGVTMLDRVADFNQSQAERGRDPIRLGIGIHSGPVVSGCLGSGMRLEFTVIGDTVNTASRLESMTKTKGVDILTSASTLESIAANPWEGADFALPNFSTVGTVDIRGRSEPLAILAYRKGGMIKAPSAEAPKEAPATAPIPASIPAPPAPPALPTPEAVAKPGARRMLYGRRVKSEMGGGQVSPIVGAAKPTGRRQVLPKKPEDAGEAS